MIESEHTKQREKKSILYRIIIYWNEYILCDIVKIIILIDNNAGELEKERKLKLR